MADGQTAQPATPMSRKMFTIFLLLVSIILISLHIGVAVGWAWVFNVEHDYRTWGIFASLGVSFPITSAIVFWKEARITNGLYALASMWLGFALYLAMAVTTGVAVVLAAQIFGWKVPTNAIVGAFIGMAVLYSCYGIWNAWHPVIKHVTVRMPHLPPAWKGKKVLQLSDIHLGPIHRQRFASMVVRLANQEQPAAVCITGDLFDGGGINLDKLADPLNNLQSEFGTFYITGNHETYVGLERSLAALQNIQLRILRDEKVDVAGLQILGIDYPLPNQKKDVRPVLAKLNPQLPSIVLYHEPKFIDEFRVAGANLVLCGHTHVGQLWPFGYITRSLYHGYDYGLHAEGTFNQYTSSGVGSWGPPMRTGNRPEIVVLTLEA